MERELATGTNLGGSLVVWKRPLKKLCQKLVWKDIKDLTKSRTTFKKLFMGD